MRSLCVRNQCHDPRKRRTALRAHLRPPRAASNRRRCRDCSCRLCGRCYCCYCCCCCWCRTPLPLHPPRRSFPQQLLSRLWLWLGAGLLRLSRGRRLRGRSGAGPAAERGGKKVAKERARAARRVPAPAAPAPRERRALVLVRVPVPQAHLLAARVAGRLVAQEELLLAPLRRAPRVLRVVPLSPVPRFAVCRHMPLESLVDVLAVKEVDRALADGAHDRAVVCRGCGGRESG